MKCALFVLLIACAFANSYEDEYYDDEYELEEPQVLKTESKVGKTVKKAFQPRSLHNGFPYRGIHPMLREDFPYTPYQMRPFGYNYPRRMAPIGYNMHYGRRHVFPGFKYGDFSNGYPLGHDFNRPNFGYGYASARDYLRYSEFAAHYDPLYNPYTN